MVLLTIIMVHSLGFALRLLALVTLVPPGEVHVFAFETLPVPRPGPA